nr:hypothetical protein [uncultured Blautia sp.]
MQAILTSELLNSAVGFFFDILDILISILPSAPFRAMLASLENSSGMEVLGYVNYFIPFKFCATCLNLWLGCVIAYYVYKYLKQAINDFRNKR